MPKPETLMDLLTIGDITEGDLKKIAAELWDQHGVASEALNAPYRVLLPAFSSLPEHVQKFIIKGLLSAKVTAEFRVKTKRRKAEPVGEEPDPYTYSGRSPAPFGPND